MDKDIHPLDLHRYPSRLQEKLKQQLCDFRNTHIHTDKDLVPENVFLGIGSVESIDALIRCFCIPGEDHILICPPTYGMYAVSSQVNNVGVVSVPLKEAPDFALDMDRILAVLTRTPTIKLVYLTSPGNPTGSLLAKSDIETILAHPTWNGVVVLDEAYIDFADDDASLVGLVTEYPNLVVLQTLSKAFGLAGIRLGATYAPIPIANLLNNLRAAWNIPSPTSILASYALSEEGIAAMVANKQKAKLQRDRLVDQLPQIRGVGRIRSGNHSNFLMFEIINTRGEPDNAVAAVVYDRLAATRGVILRYRGSEPGCFGCLRISIGTEDETTRFLVALHQVLQGMGYDVYQKDEAGSLMAKEPAKELVEDVDGLKVH